LHLPSIQKTTKLPVVLSKQEVWQMLQSAKLLKHKILIGLIYGCGLRCMEVRNIELKHLGFDRNILHPTQAKTHITYYLVLCHA
jgi:integrase